MRLRPLAARLASRIFPVLAFATSCALGCSSSSDADGPNGDASANDAGGGTDAQSGDAAISALDSDSGDAAATGHDGGDASAPSGAFPYGPYGTYKPGPATSGVRAGTTLIPYTNQFGAIVDGVLTLTTPNVTISGYDIPAFIVTKADKITIENCFVRGPATLPAAGSRNLISAYATQSTNLVVRDCTLAPTVPNHDSQGLQGKSFTAERNNVYDTVDGIDPLGDDSTILANYVHDLSWFSPDSNHADNHSHNDCVQFEGGTATVRYNNFQGFLSTTAGDGAARPYDQSNSVFQITVTSPVTTALVMDHNWMDGGQVAVNVGAGSYTNLGALTDNVFGDNQAYDGVTVLLTSARASIGLSISGNVYDAVDRPLSSSSRAGTTVDTGNGIHGG